MVYSFTLQVVDDMVASVVEGLEQIQDQLIVAAPTDTTSERRRQEMAKCQAAIQHLESMQMTPELIEPIRANLKQLQQQEAALSEAMHKHMHKHMRKAADSFKQALREKLTASHSCFFETL